MENRYGELKVMENRHASLGVGARLHAQKVKRISSSMRRLAVGERRKSPARAFE